MRLIISILILFGMTTSFAQDKPAYQLFNAEGKPVKYRKLLREVSEAEVLLFGELHNNPIAHWMQLELLKDLYTEAGRELVVGAEMFETHQQAALDSLQSAEWDEKKFAEEASMWNNYDTDYRPVVRFSISAGIPVVATNVPRKYARQVSRQGPASLDSLPNEEKALLAPLPYPIDYDIPSYAHMREMMGGHTGGMNMDYFIAAQAIKDATMAHFILTNHREGQLFYHMNGSYHSDDKEGIAWYLNTYQPGIKIANITVVEQENIDEVEEENLGKADFIIVVPATMTKTYLSGFE